MIIGWCPRGKHANKARFLAECAEKCGHEIYTLKKGISIEKADAVISYGNSFPKILPHQISINIHAGYLSRPDYHRISVGNYHPGDYIMDIPRPSDRLDDHNITIKPWKKSGEYILICTVSVTNLALFGLKYNDELERTIKILKEHTDREIIIRDRKERFGAPLSEVIKNAWAVVTWSSNCSVEAVLNGVPCFLRCGSAANPMCLTDLSRIERPYYPENRQQWLQNLAYHQFSIHEIIGGYAWDMAIYSQAKRGMIIK